MGLHNLSTVVHGYGSINRTMLCSKSRAWYNPEKRSEIWKYMNAEFETSVQDIDAVIFGLCFTFGCTYFFDEYTRAIGLGSMERASEIMSSISGRIC
jgi:hypothetical protein